MTNTAAQFPTRTCRTCGEFEGTEWVTARCDFGDPIVPAYAGEVQEEPHGFYGAVRRVGAKRATAVCRHQHKTRAAAEACGDRLAALRNAG